MFMESRPQRWDRGLYLVPTPIGNLSDMSYRAVEALRVADIILCEDTRVTKKLCAYYDIDTKLMAFHDHNEADMSVKIIQMLEGGKILALVSDAGTPLISDPGYKLVRDCAAEGVKVIALPGANAVLPGLQLSAFPTDQFYFGGFLPSKAGEREALLTANMSKMADMAQCYYESPKRLKACLKSVSQIDSAREVAVVREISKLHEEAVRGKAVDVLANFEKRDAVKGEIVLVIAPASSEKGDESYNDSLVQIVQKLIETMPLKVVASELSAITNYSKNEIYDLGLKLKNKSS
jgi:16S rRNA (cytidine1402-2'-O)-methyltransferase